MSLISHLEELRWRLLWTFFYWVVGCVVCYNLIPRLLDLTTPLLRGNKLIFTNPTEAFFAYLNAAMVGGACLAAPIGLYHLLMFVLPGLEKSERRWTLRLLPMCILQFLAGSWFALKMVLPSTMGFFLSFGTQDLIPQIKIGEFVSFVVTTTVLCGVIFELPIVLFGLAAIGLITSRFLAKQRRMAYFLSFVTAAVATPTPDAFTATMVALPILLNYELSLILIRLSGK